MIDFAQKVFLLLEPWLIKITACRIVSEIQPSIDGRLSLDS